MATLSTSTLDVGSHTIDAYYQGDGNFNGSQGSTSQTVGQASSTTLTSFGSREWTATGSRDSAGEPPLEITYTAAGNGHVNAEVMNIEEIQLKEMSDILQDKLQANDAQGARQIKHGEGFGLLIGQRRPSAAAASPACWRSS